MEAPPPVVATPEPVAPPGPLIELFGGGMFGQLDAPGQPFLATEFEDALVLGAVKFNPDAQLTGAEGGVRALLPAVNGGLRPLVRGKIRQFEADDDASLGALDPMGGVLGIPGTGDPTAAFPAGIALGGGVVASDLRASFEQSGIGGSGSLGLVLPLNGVEVAPFVAFSITAIEQETRFWGTVAALPIDFAYATNLDIDRYSLDLGTLVTVPLPPSDGVSLYVEPALHIDFTTVSGTDRLRLSGLLDDDQAVPLDGRSTDVGVSISGGMRFAPSDLPLIVDIGIMAAHRAGAVAITRSGEVGETSKARIDYVTTVVGVVRGAFRF